MNESENSHQEVPQSLLRTGRREAIQDEIVFDAPAEEVPHLLDYWNILVKRRWMVLICFLVVFSAVTIETLKQKRVYQGRALLEVNPEQSNILNLKDALQQAADATDVETYRSTQIKVIESRTLAEHVIQKLELYRNPEFYRTQVLFGIFEFDPKNYAPYSTPPLDPASDIFRGAVRVFSNSLEVKPVLRTSLIEVLYDSRYPDVAAHVANQLADEYINQNFQAKWDETSRAADWLQHQLVAFKANLEKSEDDLQQYAQANSIVFIADNRQNLVTSRLEQLQTEYTRAQELRFEKEALYRLIEAGRPQDLPGVLDDKVVQGFEEHLTDLRREYAKLTTMVKPDYPRAVQIQKQVDAVQASLADHLKSITQNAINEYKAAVSREQALGQALADQTKQVNSIAERSIHYNILKREVDTNRSLYEAMLQRLKESQLSQGMKASNVRIVESAQVPQRSIKPRMLLSLLMGATFGLLIGVVAAFFQEYMDDTFKSTDEIEKFLRLPTLGILPSFSLNGAGKAAQEARPALTAGGGNRHAVAIQTDTGIAEAFRSLRTSILLSAHPVPKMLLITSALPGEGKTTMTVNLGATLASLGSRVVIVDCDMRRPACHRSAGVENKPGLVQCLTGHATLAEAILPVPGVPNLSVIPCGPIPPNPAEVLSSPVAGDLLRELRGLFEYVLVDSPPVLSVADGRILSTMTDAVALVVRAHATPRNIVRHARELLHTAGARILGVALNGVDVHRDGYGSRYYYQYGYGYGYDPHSSGDSEHQEDV